MLRYIQDSNPKNAVDEATSEINQYVKTVKTDPRQREDYMTWGYYIDQEKAESKAEGIAEEKIENECKLIENRQNTIVDGRQLDTKKLTLDPSVQWSIGLGVGLEYRLSPVIGLYAEPSVQYFFKPGDGLDTYRTKHPAAFSVPIGIRINIK